MMSLNKASTMQNIWQQLKWKFSAYSSTIYTVIIVQIIFSLLLIDNGTGMEDGGIGNVFVRQRFYSLDMMATVSVLSLFIMGWMLATKSITQDNFSVVTTRKTAHISTVLFLLCLSVITTATSLSSLYIMVCARLVFGDINFIMPATFINGEAIILLVIMLIFASATGYFLSSLLVVSKWFVIGFVAAVYYVWRSYVEHIGKVFDYFFATSTADFVIKAVFFSVLLFAAAVVMKNAKEVQRG